MSTGQTQKTFPRITPPLLLPLYWSSQRIQATGKLLTVDLFGDSLPMSWPV